MIFNIITYLCSWPKTGDFIRRRAEPWSRKAVCRRAHFGGGIERLRPPRGESYRFGTLKKPFADYFEMVYFDMAGFEGGAVALNCALQGIRPERLVFASDYPQHFTGVKTDIGRGVDELKNYIEAIRRLPLAEQGKENVLAGTAARLVKR